jgi:DNA ligase (NAD+)
MDVVRAINRDEVALATLSVETLEKVLELAADRYYNTGDALVSDAVFDDLREILEAKDPASRFLQLVGAPVTASKRVTLPYPMRSMDKVKPGSIDLQAWQARYPGPYTLSDKLDGTSAMICYKRTASGWDVRMFRRGDDRGGFEITPLLKHFLPRELISAPPPHLQSLGGRAFAVRGEIIMSRRNFASHGGSFANARSLTNGIVNRKDPDPKVLAKTDFVAYELVHPRIRKSEQMMLLHACGYTLVATMTAREITDAALGSIYTARRQESHYEIDGMIVEAEGPNELPTRDNPKYAFAFKMPLDEQGGIVKVLQVAWAPSKDRMLKPRVRYEPITVGGATMQFATGFNAKFINDNKLGPGAVIRVVRSGDVIPYIQMVIRQGAAAQMPDVPYEWGDSGVDIFLMGDQENAELTRRRLKHFFSKMNIANISDGLIDRFYENGLTTLSAFLSATPSDLQHVDGVQATLADKLVKNIQRGVHNVPLVRVMVASNSFGAGFGERKLQTILDAMPDILADSSTMAQLTERVAALEGFSTKTASAFVSNLQGFRQFLLDHPQIIVQRHERANRGRGRLSGEVFVFTGIRDKPAEARITELGGVIAGSMSSRTTILIAKDPSADTGKLQKAREDGVRILGLQDLYVMLE